MAFGPTPFHAKYFAHLLTARSPSDDMGKLGASIFNATVDLNPHQLDAALFAFRSPLSRGAILADEVGLGKTIEAGLIISQLWAERKRRILVICPTILRKQWAQELAEKFFLASRVLDTKEYNAATKSGSDPFGGHEEVLICSYHFAAARQNVFGGIPWDLVVIDEAHRLRNVWKPSNKIANALHAAVSNKPLVLLTATPLQNSLLELYGLVSFIDEHMFGSIEAFKMRYMRGALEERQLGELRHRMKPICQRTLRRQVQEYVRFTNRIPITQDFTPTHEEQRLYDQVSEYLQRPTLHALPASQRKLMTLILRKLLASSSFAISKTLNSIADRLENDQKDLITPIAEEYDGFEETAEEWGDENPPPAPEPVSLDAEILAEIQELRNYGSLADSILKNAKGEALLTALESGFRKMTELGASKKAVIFTESRRTQEYLVELLNSHGYEGRVLTINGTNTDDRSGAIYKSWRERHKDESVVTGNKAVDLRAALVEHFRNHADILIATEAASEGVNLQFCSLVINFDLPWNPQRIEQRIGRCHRYGQSHDVVVVNFLNRSNEADQRVYELLDEKFRLFDGVFGSSDEILGALESGVDFERRIADIVQNCRTKEEIDQAFDQLRAELEAEITNRMTDTRAKLLENFNEEVHERLKISRDESARHLDRFERALWGITKLGLKNEAEFNDDDYEFELMRRPHSAPDVPLGKYKFVRRSIGSEGAHPYRLGQGLADVLLNQAMRMDLPSCEVRFAYSGQGRKIGLLDSLIGQSGWLQITKLTVASFEEEDHLLVAIINENGESLHEEVGAALFQAEAEMVAHEPADAEILAALERQTSHLIDQTLAKSGERNRRFFEEELEKLERWADDLKNGLEMELKELDQKIKQAGKDSKLAPTLDAKLEFVKQQKELETARNKKRRELYEAQDRIDVDKGNLIELVAARLRQTVDTSTLMTVRFAVT